MSSYWKMNGQIFDFKPLSQKSLDSLEFIKEVKGVKIFTSTMLLPPVLLEFWQGGVKVAVIHPKDPPPEPAIKLEA
jgi:hypothetical protein